jgi:sphingomyelin phosphodiesterase
LYKPLADALYNLGMLDEDSAEDYGNYGRYATEVESGLTVISLQTNYCNRQNLYLYNDYITNGIYDPAGQLAWLVEQLQAAEDAGTKVHIIGHVPSGHSDCIPTWGDQFYQIVNRYEYTITGLFYGHRHTDSFEMFYTQDEGSCYKVCCVGLRIVVS